MNRMQFFRQRVLPLLFAIALFALFRYQMGQQLVQVVLEGKTMGTTYHIKYRAKKGPDYQAEIDSILRGVNQAVSTYIPESEISRFNRQMELEYELPYFYPILEVNREIYQKTGGALDPTVMPLVYAWGFGPGKQHVLDSATVDSLLNLVGFDHIQFNEQRVWKDKPGVQLDFSASAKGFGVDMVAEFLKKQGVEHMMVEIGGEVVCYGESKPDQTWRIGIDDPKAAETGNMMRAAVTIKDGALATSGNYRNFYVKDGKKYAHTISPFTGFPVEHSLLSASVFAPTCTKADGYATAFMVMGVEKAKKVLEREAELEGYLIYSDAQGQIQTYLTEGLKDILVE